MKIIIIALIASVLVASCAPQTAEDKLAVQFENCADPLYKNVVMDNLPLGEGKAYRRIEKLVEFLSQNFAEKLVDQYKYRDAYIACKSQQAFNVSTFKSLYSSRRDRTIDSPLIKELKEFQKTLDNY